MVLQKIGLFYLIHEPKGNIPGFHFMYTAYIDKLWWPQIELWLFLLCILLMSWSESAGCLKDAERVTDVMISSLLLYTCIGYIYITSPSIICLSLIDLDWHAECPLLLLYLPSVVTCVLSLAVIL